MLAGPKEDSSKMLATLHSFFSDRSATFVDDEGGQSTVEYLLLISVIVIAVVAAAYVFVPTFQSGVTSLAQDVQSMLDSGKIGKTGTNR